MNKNYYDDDYYQTNRDKRLAPKNGHGYCICDRSIVSSGQKCNVCGNLQKRKRLKR